jgi:hypothetical protein
MVVMLIGILFIYHGLTAAPGCTGTSLSWTGAGVIISGFDGSVAFRSWFLGVAGAGGFVLLLIGSVFGMTGHC